MFLSDVTDRGATPALIKGLAFNEARLAVIAENVANSETPGYRTKTLDVPAFQAALRTALDQRHANPSAPFSVRSGQEVVTDGRGFLRVTPSLLPPENLLFHDGTNMSLERQMVDLAETGMAHQTMATILNGRFETIRKAIRGGV